MKISIMASILALSGFAYAGSYATVEEFCKKENIDKEGKAKTPVLTHQAILEKMGKVLSPDKDCAFIKENSKKAGWALVDARDPETRKSTGTFEDVVKIVSDHNDLSNHQFKEDVFYEKISKHLEGQGRKPSSIDDSKKANLMIFCNGPSCYRTPWAACSLNSMGFKKENLYFIVEGYEGLKKQCFK